MPYGYVTIRRSNDVEFIDENYWWQLPVSGGQQYREYLRDPADGIPPPATYSAHHNQLLAVKEEDWSMIEEDEEGYHVWLGGSMDAASTITDNLDAADRIDFQQGTISLEYMDLVGLGDWARKHGNDTREQLRAYEQVIIAGTRTGRISTPGHRVEVTEELMELRHERNEERLYDLYLRRRREERDRREQRDF